MMGLHGPAFRASLSTEDEKPKVTRELMKRVLSYSWPYRWKIAAMLVIILIKTGLDLLRPLILRNLIDVTIPSKDITRLIELTIALLLIPTLTGWIGVWQRRLNSQVGEGVIYDLRVALFSRLQRMSLRFFTHTKVGELMSRLNNDVIGAQNAISNTIVSIITDIVQAVSVLVVMIALEWRLTIISIIIVPLFILAARQIGNRLRDIARKQMDANARMNAMMIETLNISGAMLVKLFGRIETEIDRFSSRAGKVRDWGIERAVVGSSFFMVIGLLGAIGTALVYGIGGYLVINGTFSIGMIVAFGAYLGTLYSALQGLSTAPVEFATSVVSFERVFEVIDLPQDIQEVKYPLSIDKVEGRLEFINVSFKYDVNENILLRDVQRFGRNADVEAVLSGVEEVKIPGESIPKSQAREHALKNINVLIKPGQLIALVGPSGAGKTTLTYLIPRLYDPTEGNILLDGYNLRNFKVDSLANFIGMVTQETHLFHDTIRTNLLYARLDAAQEELEAAAKIANIHDFVSALPEGYDTVVGERGYRLSGGEKQRIAIARVILKNPSILVLDEATSHLDSESEALIQEALKRIMANRTSIVIAHRLSTILAADLILVIDRGEIVERGTHDTLLEQGGLYAQLYETQFKREP